MRLMPQDIWKVGIAPPRLSAIEIELRTTTPSLKTPLDCESVDPAFAEHVPEIKLVPNPGITRTSIQQEQSRDPAEVDSL